MSFLYRMYLSLVTAIVFFITPHPPVDDSFTVNQGDKISIGWSDCTVGYVDPYEKILFTAGHCGKDGQTVSVHGNKVGTIERIDGYSQKFRDLAAIKVTNPKVRVGKNKFSGDRIVDPADIKPEDKVCVHSRIRNRDFCIQDHRIWIGEESKGTEMIIANFQGRGFRQHTLLGDSGGPSWIPGKGAIGPLSGYLSNGESTSMSLKDFADSFVDPFDY